MRSPPNPLGGADLNPHLHSPSSSIAPTPATSSPPTSSLSPLSPSPSPPSSPISQQSAHQRSRTVPPPRQAGAAPLVSLPLSVTTPRTSPKSAMVSRVRNARRQGQEEGEDEKRMRKAQGEIGLELDPKGADLNMGNSNQGEESLTSSQCPNSNVCHLSSHHHPRPHNQHDVAGPSTSTFSSSGSPQISALRPTSSTLSTGKKQLRFTPMTDSRMSQNISRDQVDYLRSDPGTPNLSETADQIRRTLSLASLDSLLILSTDASQRERIISEVSKAGRDLVWRAKDEKKLFPKDAERAVVLAAKRGIPVVSSADDVIQALSFWPFAFGAMIGSFTFLNTLTLHLLRLAPPWAYVRKRFKAGLEKPSFGPPEREGDEGERRWQAAVAGAVGSLGLLFETANRRAGVSQQMFVRGLQATYNQMGFNIPHGDLLVFGLCCGQIMFAWLLSPETIPKEYSNWILSASRVPEFAVLANRTAVRHNLIAPAQVQRALQHKDITMHSKAVLERLLAKLEQGLKPNGFVPCEMIHPWCDSCLDTNFRRFFSVFRFMLPVYSALHIIPMLVLRRHHVARDPLRMLARAIWGITRSCSFLGSFVVIYQGLFCLRSQTMKFAPESILRILRRKETFWVMGFTTCLSLLSEERKRRAELAMYVLPRALESGWSSLRKRSYLPLVPFGETILGAVAMAMVMDAYKHSPECLSGVVRRLLYQIVGPV